MNYVISIVNPPALDTLTALCAELSLPLTTVLHGRGTAVPSMLELLGIESNEKRAVLAIADEDKTAALLKQMKQKLHIGVPGHGIFVAVPVKSVGGGKAVAYLNGGNAPAKAAPAINTDYELIVTIASSGHTDTVMNAARSAGARGGTVLHGKGTGAEGAPSFYNISIAEEKELVFIVSAKTEKAAIMQAILRAAGPGTEAGGIVFSLPVTDVAGFGMFE